jgi:predicted DNA-binding transcriptional regulator YafY
MLPVVQEAVSRDRKLAMRYRPATGDRVERRVDPLGLVAKGTTWYLVAGTPRGLRTYRVSRIEKATMLEARCQRPADFDLARYWKSSTEALRKSRSRYWATLRLDPEAARQLGAWRPATTARESRADPGQGRVTRRLHFDDEEEAGFVVLGLGSRAEVVEPASLRERVNAEVGRMALRLSR